MAIDGGEEEAVLVVVALGINWRVADLSLSLGYVCLFSMYFIELCVKVEILRYIQNQNTTIAEKKVIAKNIAEDL